MRIRDKETFHTIDPDMIVNRLMDLVGDKFDGYNKDEREEKIRDRRSLLTKVFKVIKEMNGFKDGDYDTYDYTESYKMSEITD
jgi:hypothetical protein